MSKNKKTKDEMISDILLAVKASQTKVSAEMFFGLAFRTELELQKICRELHVSIYK